MYTVYKVPDLLVQDGMLEYIRLCVSISCSSALAERDVYTCRGTFGAHKCG